MELEVTWGRAIRVWWAFLWRNLIAILLAMLLGGVLGFIIDYIIAAAGGVITKIQIILGSIGSILGLGTSIVPIKMILGKDFGEFRLVLAAKS